MDRDGGLAFVDEDGEEVDLDPGEAADLLGLIGSLDAATVSACPGCRSRVLACVALVDLLGGAAVRPRTRELSELAEDAPTLHLYVQDVDSACTHRGWRDPGYLEWSDVLDELVEPRRGVR